MRWFIEEAIGRAIVYCVIGAALIWLVLWVLSGCST